jgi:dTDP-4-amino-4,6-dideoxygalactose transaminase
MSNPHQVTKDFEAAICAYTGAPFAVAVNSCSMALLLALAHALQSRPNERVHDIQADVYLHKRPKVEIPKFTYVGVPMGIVHAGARPIFRDEEWSGFYQLKPFRVWDSARWFTEGLYKRVTSSCPDGQGGMVCVSFHASKTLGLEQGGAILHNDPRADEWLRRARFDGRTSGVDPRDDLFPHLGYHCYMNPSTAAQGLLKLYSLPRENAPLPNDPYPDLSKLEIFR